MVKELSIMNQDWDRLILLDGCRYDYFEKIYGEYLNGKLQKVKSVASHTSEWLTKTFGKRRYEDIVYLSANPRVNSLGIKTIGGFDGRKQFGKVIDIWDTGWDEELKTVPPEEVSKAVMERQPDFTDKRLIIHFIQPHPPYIRIGPLGGKAITFPKATSQGGGESESKMGSSVKQFFGKLARKALGRGRFRKVLAALRMRALSEYEKVAEKYGQDGLREAYEANLKMALEEAAKLADALSGKIIVTSDHGDLLGEDGLYGHPPNLDHPILRNIPWLVV